MSFQLMGYEAIPVNALYSSNNDILCGFVTSCVGNIGFAYRDNVAGGHADGYYGYVKPEFLKDAVVEWPVSQQVRSFYLVKWRLCDDPMAREKIEKADQEIYRRNRDRFRVLKALRVKRMEKACILSQSQTLIDEDKQLNRILEKKEPIDNRESGLCSSEEELDDLISSLYYRISNCSQSEERRLTCEINRLEMTRGRVKSNAVMRTWILEMSPEYASQGEVAGEALEEVKKKQEMARVNIEHHKKELQVVEGEIKALEDELTDVILKRDRAYTRIQELRKQRDERNGDYYHYRAVSRDARVLAAANDATTLEKLLQSEVEDFFARWNSDGSFRENYQSRIQPSLDLRYLACDGRSLSGYMTSVVREGPEKAGMDEERAVEDTGGVVVANNLSTPEVVSDNTDDRLDNGKNRSFALCKPSEPVGNPENKSENGDDFATKNGNSRLITDAEILWENCDDLAGEKNFIVDSNPSFDSAPILDSMRSLASSQETVSENGYDFTSGKNNNSNSVPSSGSVLGAEILSENGDVGLRSNISENSKEADEVKLRLKEVLIKDASFVSEDTEEGDHAKLKLAISEDAEGINEAKPILIEAARDDLSIAFDTEGANGALLKLEEMGSENLATLSEDAEDGGDMTLNLKEMRREEELEKAKKAIERKKKLAEKNAVKAAMKAQKEAEKKLKEQEKKAKRKAAAPTILPEQEQEQEEQVEKAGENVGAFARVTQRIYIQRDKYWRRHRSKGNDPVLKAILKRRRSANYWFWAVAIALILAVFTVVGYCFLLQQF